MAWKPGRTGSALIILAGCVVLSVQAKHAWAECAIQGQKLKPAVIERFEKEPKELLDSYPRGGYAMSEATFQLAARGPKATAKLLSAAPMALFAQQKAMGEGLRRFVDLCSAKDPDGVKAVNSLVASAGVASLSRAFLQGDDAPSQLPGRGAGQAPPLPDDLTSSAGDNSPFNPFPDPFGRLEEWR